MLQILSQDLKYYIKNAHELVYLYGFFALLIVIVPMGLRQQLHLLPELAPVMLWIALTASMGLGALSLFQRDAESGVLELYQQLPFGLGQAVLGKWLAFYLANAIPLVVSTPLLLALYGLPMELSLHYIVGAAAGAGALSLLSTLAASITVGLERARAVVLLVLMPLSVPVIIFGSDYMRHTDALWQPQLMFLLALSVFLMPLLYLAGASCIRASN